MKRQDVVRWFAGALLAALAGGELASAQEPTKSVVGVTRSKASGPWSAAGTWEGGKVPAAGARVQIRAGHTVTYDVKSDHVMRMVHIAGTLTFAHDKDTRLDVGLIKIQAGDDCSEGGFDCDAHVAEPAPHEARPALEVGSPLR